MCQEPCLPDDHRLTDFLVLLDRWNHTHALTALPFETRREELLVDSAALLPHLAHLPTGSTVADFGTGMGVPAIVLAVCRPDLNVLGIDKAGKKMAFLRQVILELKIPNLTPVAGQIESLPPIHAQAGVAKAVGSLTILAGWWKRHGASGAPFFALKGPDWISEPKPKGWSCMPHPYRLPTRGERVIVELASE